ncbi:MAG: HEAT repeat domain-containing protein [Planctomycetota bacterium]
MKHIALAGLFALVAPAVAQEGAAAAPKWSKQARLEVAKAVAAEEQERDLDKAQQLYRAAMQDADRSDEARSFAASRLAALLRRLGKADEADAVLRQAGKGVVASLDDVTNGRVGQDRVKELRAQARVLVQRILDKGNGRRVMRRTQLTGVSREDSDQLFWIGDPAIVEVAAGLQEELKKPYGGRVGKAPGLFEFLWMRGGPVASRFLLDAIEGEVGAQMVALAASSATEIDLDSPGVRALLENESVGIAMNFLDGLRGEGGAIQKLTTDQLLTVCERGRPAVRALVLPKLAARRFEAHELKRAHELVRAALQGADPKLGKAAELFVTSTASQQSVTGLTMLLERLHDLDTRGVTPAPWARRGTNRNFSVGEAVALLPAIDETSRQMRSAAKSTARQWLTSLMIQLVYDAKDDRVMHAALRWADRGYEVYEAISHNITRGTLVPALERAPEMSADGRRILLSNVPTRAMSAEALPRLLAVAPELGDDLLPRVGRLVSFAGTDEAVDWIMDQWRQAKVRFPESAANYTKWVPEALIRVGRSNRSERVRAAMRAVVRGFGGPQARGKELARLLLALMSMSDERVLDFLGVGVGLGQRGHHPYPEGASQLMSPVGYLLDNGDPKHGYSDEQAAAVVRKLAAMQEHVPLLEMCDPKLVSDALLLVLAEHDRTMFKNRTWINEVVHRLNVRLHAGDDVDGIEPYFLQQLGRDGRLNQWFYLLPARIVDRYRKQIAALLDGDDGEWAEAACVRLWRHDRGIDLRTALENEHATVRLWAIDRLARDRTPVESAVLVARLDDPNEQVRLLAANRLGAMVSKQAVPKLIELLKDPVFSVQEEASKALTRIRFYHEQQAHWDRILKGMDASPQSAVEKLLLQAKPTARKEQRLLAIASLGVLGKPEALPFLIDWTQDADAAIAEAAKAAVQKIHLDPKK